MRRYVTGVLATLHEDRHLVVYDKPAGIPVVPGRQGGENLAATTGHLVCHRLDTETSGVLVMAKTAAGQRMVSTFFAERKVKKGYLAVCAPGLADAGDCELPLGEWHRGRVAIGRGKPSRTRWLVRERTTNRLLVEAFPETGRTHQVRAHLSASGGPIAGDEAYGGTPTGRILLHAWWLELPWPKAQDRLRVLAPPPPEFGIGFAPVEPTWP